LALRVSQWHPAHRRKSRIAKLNGEIEGQDHQALQLQRTQRTDITETDLGDIVAIAGSPHHHRETITNYETPILCRPRHRRATIAHAIRRHTSPFCGRETST